MLKIQISYVENEVGYKELESLIKLIEGNKRVVYKSDRVKAFKNSIYGKMYLQVEEKNE